MRVVQSRIFGLVPFIRNLPKRVDDQGKYPAGHYYSPIPIHEDDLAYIESLKSNNTDLPDIALNKEDQYKFL